MQISTLKGKKNPLKSANIFFVICTSFHYSFCFLFKISFENLTKNMSKSLSCKMQKSAVNISCMHRWMAIDHFLTMTQTLSKCISIVLQYTLSFFVICASVELKFLFYFYGLLDLWVGNKKFSWQWIEKWLKNSLTI